MNIIQKVYAVDPWSGLDRTSGEISTWAQLLGKVNELFRFIVPFSALVAVIMLVVGGYTFMTAMGDPERIKKGQGIVTAAVVGMILVFLSQLIVKFIIGLVE